MKLLPDYEHMEYRDVYTCRTYAPGLRLRPGSRAGRRVGRGPFALLLTPERAGLCVCLSEGRARGGSS